MNTLNIEITVLQEICSAIVHEKSVKELLDRILRILSNRIGILHGEFAFTQGNMPKVEASYGVAKSEQNNGIYISGEGITGQVAQTGKSKVIQDISKDKQLNRTTASGINKRTALFCVPVAHMGHIIGTLSATKPVTPDLTIDHNLRFFEIIGKIAADAVFAALAAREEKEQLLNENRQLREMLAGNTKIIGNSRCMQDVYAQIKQVAPSDATVFLRGSSGTGKELVARAIVELSGRKNKPFVTLNCAAIPENLVESELFGHEKGAFTGAVQRRIGRAEAADGGTLFLDEVGDLSLMAQVKLLRFIQERTFSRVGNTVELKADVRFIAATSRNLEELIAENKFREDLYYRLNVYPINMPDLADRKSDIIQLAEHFLEKHNLRYNKSVSRLSTPAINMLTAYHWPGNVRELENCIERAVLTATDDCIRSYNMPPSLQTGQTSGTELIPGNGASFNTLVDSFERELIVEALKRNEGNMSAAARDLELSPRVIHYKVNRLGITPALYSSKN